MSLILVSCANEVIDNNTMEISSKANANEKKLQAEPNLTPTPNEKSSAESIGICQPKSNFVNEAASQDADINQTLPKPDSREAFNDWLKDLFGSVQVATLPNRKFINEYYWEGDLNADGCQDIAVLAESIKDKSKEISMENLVAGTVLQNLRSKVIFKSGVADSAFSKKLARQIQPEQQIAVAVVFGGKKGWNWKRNAVGREFLLYDSIFKPVRVSGYETGSILFGLVKKDKPNEDYDDLLNLFPTNAVGDCLYTATQIKRKKNVFSELSNKFLICFDGEVFFDRPLPNSKSYPE